MRYFRKSVMKIRLFLKKTFTEFFFLQTFLINPDLSSKDPE
jgi:hypothetical protein